MHDQTFLNNYFANTWDREISDYTYSGYAIINKVHEMDHVLDVGCGNNHFKGKIKKLIGLDPANANADVISTIEEFEPDQKFDVALCLGSINFGTVDIIAEQIEKVNSLLNEHAKIFWRLNPGLHDHDNNQHEQIEFYPWTFPKLKEFALEYGFEQKNCAIDSDGKVVRLYAEWHR